MTDTITYVEDLDGTSYPIYGLGLGDLGPVTGFFGRSYGVEPGVEEASVLIAIDGDGDEGQERGSFIVDEYKDGVEVGVASFTGFVASSTGYDPGMNVIYALGTSVIQITGEFDAFPCFATGTLIGTTDGDVAVEALTEGHVLALANGGDATVTWLGHRRQINGDVIRIRRHALGHHTPSRDLIVSADHGMFIDGALVQAGLLVNGETIIREHRPEVTFWHVELARHAILLAEGAPAESYLDTGNRRQFSNCALGYDPSQPGQEPCAEVVLAGERLERIRSRLLTVA
jgi:hypothetical protein